MKKSLKTMLATTLAVGAFAVPAFAAEQSAAPVAEKTAAPVVAEAKDVTASDTKLVAKNETATSEELTSVVEKAVGDVRGIRPTIGLGFEARFFAPHMDAKVSSDSISYNNGKVGLKDTLGFDNDNAPEFIFRYGRFSADWIHVHGTGKATLNDTLKFDDKRLAGRVKSTSNFDYIKLDMKNPIVSLPLVSFNWNYGLSVLHWKGEVKGNVVGTGLGTTASEEYWAPVPYLGLGAAVDLDPAKTIKVYANLSGLPLGSYGHFYDLEAGLRYNPIDELVVTAGYRRIDIDGHHDNDKGKITLNGPFAGVAYTF